MRSSQNIARCSTIMKVTKFQCLGKRIYLAIDVHCACIGGQQKVSRWCKQSMLGETVYFINASGENVARRENV